MKRVVTATLIAMLASAVRADDLESVPDVRVPTGRSPVRRLALELDPLPMLTDLGKLSADLVIVPIDHHAVVVTALYTSTSTAPIRLLGADGSPIAQLPEQRFRGAGVEFGYRYYAGLGGPRGWFVGPSAIFVAMFERQGQFGDGSHTDYYDLGIAVDAGYQVLVADRVSLGLGVGVQGLITSRSMPAQQFPAKLYGNRGIWPRLGLSIGWAM